MIYILIALTHALSTLHLNQENTLGAKRWIELPVVKASEYTKASLGARVMENWTLHFGISDDGIIAYDEEAQFGIFSLPEGSYLSHNLIQFYVLKGNPPKIIIGRWTQFTDWNKMIDVNLFFKPDPYRYAHFVSLVYASKKDLFLAMGTAEGVISKRRTSEHKIEQKWLGFAVVSIIDLQEKGDDPNRKGYFKYNPLKESVRPLGAAFDSNNEPIFVLEKYNKAQEKTQLVFVALRKDTIEIVQRADIDKPVVPLYDAVNPISGMLVRGARKPGERIGIWHPDGAIKWLDPPVGKIARTYLQGSKVILQMYSENAYTYDENLKDWVQELNIPAGKTRDYAWEEFWFDPAMHNVVIFNDKGSPIILKGYRIRGMSSNGKFWILHRLADKRVFLVEFP